MDLHCHCVVFCSAQNLSNLSNNLSNDLRLLDWIKKRDAKTYLRSTLLRISASHHAACERNVISLGSSATASRHFHPVQFWRPSVFSSLVAVLASTAQYQVDRGRVYGPSTMMGTSADRFTEGEVLALTVRLPLELDPLESSAVIDILHKGRPVG